MDPGFFVFKQTGKTSAVRGVAFFIVFKFPEKNFEKVINHDLVNIVIILNIRIQSAFK